MQPFYRGEYIKKMHQNCAFYIIVLSEKEVGA